jgi:hypothetical protein
MHIAYVSQDFFQSLKPFRVFRLWGFTLILVERRLSEGEKLWWMRIKLRNDEINSLLIPHYRDIDQP